MPDSTSAALVSFVVPTRGRAQLLVRAVRSALAQTYRRIEVVVVIDGPDAEAPAALRSVNDTRLRVITLAAPVGGAEARNLGIRYAAGEWIALLDDDDEALPGRVERQMVCAAASRHKLPVISGRFHAVGSRAEEVLPRRVYRGDDLARYLFVRRSLRYGDGLLHTSTLLAPRQLLLAVPFAAGLARHQDWDLVLRLARVTGVGFEMVQEPVARVYMEEQRSSVSRAAGPSDWRFSLLWARERRSILGRRAFAAFLATECMPRAAKSGASPSERLRLLAECLRAWPFSPQTTLLALFFALDTRRRKRV